MRPAPVRASVLSLTLATVAEHQVFLAPLGVLAVLGHDTLEAELAGVREDGRTVTLEVIIELGAAAVRLLTEQRIARRSTTCREQSSGHPAFRVKKWLFFDLRNRVQVAS